jgi:signal peptidase I
MANEQGKIFFLVKKLVDEFLFPLALLVLVIIILPKFLLASPVPYFVVPTKSMTPTIWPGDILFSEGWDLDSIRPGDIVVYRGYNALTHQWYWIVHRVQEIRIVNGTRYLITAGDYNLQLCKKDNLSLVYCYDNGTLYPDEGLPLKKCPLFGEPREFCVAGKVLQLGDKPLKIPVIGKLLLAIRRNL